MADYISQFTGSEIDQRLTKVPQLESGKQDALVSGENIKTVGGQSLLGSGNITVGDENAVKFIPQTLTAAQKAQALANIGAASLEQVANMDFVNVTSLPTASASTMGHMYLVGPDANNNYDRYVTKKEGSTYSWTPYGSTQIDLSTYATKAEVNQLEAEVTDLNKFIPDESYKGYINSGVWADIGAGSRQYKVVPIKSGSKSVVFKANANGGAIYFLSSYSPESGQSTGIISGQGVNANVEAHLDIPASTTYIYFLYLSGTDRTPAKFIVDGVDFLGTVKDEAINGHRISLQAGRETLVSMIDAKEFELEAGNMTSTGGNTSGTAYLRQRNAIKTTTDFITLPEGFVFRTAFYYSSWESSSSFVLSTKVTINAPSFAPDTTYPLFRVSIQKYDGSNIQPSDLLHKLYLVSPVIDKVKDDLSFIPDTLYQGYINDSGSWVDVGVGVRYYKVINIEGASIVMLVGGANASAYRFLTSFYPASGQDTGIVQGVGGALNANAQVIAQVPTGAKFLYVQWLSGTDRSPAQIVVDGVNFYTQTRTQIFQNAKDSVDVDNSIKRISSKTIDASFYATFVRGTLSSGTYVSLSYRVCSAEIMTYETALHLVATTGFRFGIHTFVGGVFSTDSGWKTDYTIPARTSFKIVIARSQQTENTSEVADIDTFVGSISVNGGDSAIFMLYKTMIPDWDIPGVDKKKVSETTGTQGLTRVGDIYIQFNASNDDHTNVASLYRYTDGFESMANMSHNFGHAASADYDAESDCLIIGNGSGDTSVLPRMDIVQGAKAKILAGGTLSYSGEDVIHIELNAETKELGGTGLICCYGGNWRIVYLATGQGTAPRRIFKCVLGVGEEDFSDQTAGQTDATAWGTFIPGKSNSEYNGTLKVLSVHIGPETGTYQGICFRAGFIYLACGVSEPLVHKIRLTSDSFSIVQTNQPLDYNADGTKKTCEPEGLCFVDATTMLVGLPAYGGLFTINAF